jgi:hypothetical protein
MSICNIIVTSVGLGKSQRLGAVTVITMNGSKGLRNTDVQARGLIFFPGEAKRARELGLQIKKAETGKIHTHIMIL